MPTPFDTIEGAHEYLSLLVEAVNDTSRGIGEDIEAARANRAARRGDALRLVEYKLGQLEGHLTASRRLLNDLRTLRRLILNERKAPG